MGETKEKGLSKEFVERQRLIILERIDKYTNRQRIKEELLSSDVSPYILHKQKNTLPKLQKALELIEKGGAYGFCAKCGKQIEIGRLKLVPAAFSCISCLPEE